VTERASFGLAQVASSLGAGLRRVLALGRPANTELYEDLLDALVLTDAGVAAATAVVNETRQRAERLGVLDAGGLRVLLAEVVAGQLGAGEHDRTSVSEPGVEPAQRKEPDRGGLTLPSGLGVVLLVGVNGTGKTTTVAKLALRLLESGRKPLLVQADTFRPAATEQTLIWADRLELEVVHHRPGSDPAAVAFDGVRAALARHRDVVLVDTAGRLHSRTGLIDELKKIRRVLAREVEGAPHETLLVVDGAAGLNSLEQARVFNEAVVLTGVIITKLDGTARGGVVLAIRRELGIPVRFVGVGERLQDLADFDPVSYARGMLQADQ
jgi:fused signal recognition particle receptor